MYQYRAVVDRIVDGDTLDVVLDYGFFLTQRMRLRLAGVNTPEVHGEEKEAGLKSKAFVEGVIPAGSVVVVETEKQGKYGRYVASVKYLAGSDDWREIVAQGRLLNDELVEKGLAEVWA